MDWKLLSYCVFLPFITALVLVFWIHPKIVRIALSKDIVDKPGQRKLQKSPVPVLGGTAVFCGLIVGAGLTGVFFDSNALFPVVVAMTVMLYIGTMDDIIGLSPWLRLIIEVVMVCFIMYMENVSINNFHGLFGIYELPMYVAIPLSVTAGVGIINAINLIDGVDGLSSGFCIMACGVFGFAFITSTSYKMAVLASLGAGSLLPFFMHNVFGSKSKMFIGDGGSLTMGTIMSIFAFYVVCSKSKVAYNYTNMGVAAFALSTLSVPVFDTVRVMTARMIKGISPFHADKTHLHHIFIRLGFSHAGTTASVLSINFANIIIWLAAYQIGLNATGQFLVVLATGFLSTTGLYCYLDCHDESAWLVRVLKRLADKTHIENKYLFNKLRTLMDRI